MNKVGQFIANGILLTLISLLIRTVSVVFNVYVSNTIGAEALGLFTLVSTVYGFGLTLATSGINLAATRCVAEAGGDQSEIKAAMRKCITYSLSFGFGAALLLFILAQPISLLWLNDIRAANSLRRMAFSLLPFP